MKLKGGAMYYALMMAIIIGIMSASLMLYNYLNNKQLIILQKQKQVVDNVLSAINLYTVNGTDLKTGESKVINLFDDEQQQVQVSKKMWGGFEKLTATANYNSFTFSKTALIGHYLSNMGNKALYLADLNKPLSLCGKTEIVGDAELPASGVQRAYIEGQSFVGTKLVNGIITNSSKSLPEINTHLIDENLKYLQGQYSAEDSVVSIDILEKDTIVQPFNEKTMVINAPQINLLKGIIKGNIRVVASDIIFVGRDAQLKDVILYAPTIIIEHGFDGALQAFASDSMVIENDVMLKYPSFLALATNDQAGHLIINQNSEIAGAVIAVQQQNSKNNNYISIERGVELTGQLYTNGAVDLKGSVYGNVICKKFMLKTPSSVYENHLLNAVIDITKLPETFAGIDLWLNDQNRKMVKWLE